MYITKQGQTWDMIAKEVYNDEMQAGMLMQENPGYIETFIFEAGCEIVTPEIDETDDTTLPDWRSA